MNKGCKSKQSQLHVKAYKMYELQNLRIFQKNLLYLTGISARVCEKDLLIKTEYLGQYGKILRLVINKNQSYTSDKSNSPCYSAYVTYSTIQEASLALLALDNFYYDGFSLKANFGTTKYCLYYLRNLECLNKDCLFLHHTANKEDIINKEDVNYINSYAHYNSLAIKYSNIFNNETKNQILLSKKAITCEFPSISTIYKKQFVIEEELKLKKNEKLSLSSGNSMNYTEKNNLIKQDLGIIFKTTEKKKELRILDELSFESKITDQINNSFCSLESEKTSTDSSSVAKKCLFCKSKEKSRFNFVDRENTDNNNFHSILIPEIFNKYITKSTSTYPFLKNIDIENQSFTNINWFEISFQNTQQSLE